MFGRTLVNSCPVSSSTLVNVRFLEDLDTVELIPNEHEAVSNREVLFDAGNITQSKILNVYCRFKNKDTTPMTGPITPILAHTYISRQSSSSSGYLVTLFTNSHPYPVKILYLQIVPWYLRTYLHTLSLKQILPEETGSLQPDDMWVKLAKDRSHPYTIETALTIPADSTVKFSVQFEPLMLRWNEYPPDAHHGRNVPSGVVTFWGDNKQLIRMYTETPLVYLPTPDFSMPFNVLCLVSTVIAIVYGSIFSLTTKSLVCIKETEVKQGLLLQLINAIRGALKQDPSAPSKTLTQGDSAVTKTKAECEPPVPE